MDKSVSEKSAASYGHADELTRVVLLEDRASKVVEKHVGGQGAFQIVTVGVLEGFFLFLLLGLLTLFSLVLRLAAVSLRRFALRLGSLLISGLRLVLGALFLCVVLTYTRIKISVQDPGAWLIWCRPTGCSTPSARFDCVRVQASLQARLRGQQK